MQTQPTWLGMCAKTCIKKKNQEFIYIENYVDILQTA